VSIDYGERERQFLDTLKADTGRALEEWMAAIAAEGLTHRNDIIDWLRRQGFMFSKASWLERIHNNGGRPIYTGAGNPRPQVRPRPRTHLVQTPRLVETAQAQPVPTLPSSPRQPPPSAPPPAPQQPPAPTSAPLAAAGADALDALLARAKAFRPLAVYLIAEIRKNAPEVAVDPRDGYLAFRIRDTDFALLAVSAKELRLGLALKSAPAGAPLEPAKLPALRGAPAVSHMAILTDARQITPALLAAVAQAATGA
jgi:predicted transport protein